MKVTRSLVGSWKRNPTASLRTVLSESDYVALIVPLTPQTAGLLGKAELALMKPGAVLINVGRPARRRGRST